MWCPRRAGRALIAAGVIAVPLLIAALPASADPGSGSVSVQATNNSAITLSVSDGSADFGSNLDPLGTDSNSSDRGQVSDFQSDSGSYYVWRSGGGNGVVVTVKSNKSWTGSVSASPNTGTSRSLTIESGALRYNTSSPRDYWDAALSPAFSTSGTDFEVTGTKGVHTYNYFYNLRVNWDDDPGTLSSTVTYSATH